MQVKFNNDEKFYKLDEFNYISRTRAKLCGADVPKDNTSGFCVYDDEENLLYNYTECTVVYDAAEGYVEYTSDASIYNVYYVFDAATSYVSHQMISKSTKEELNMDNVVLVKSGQGKEFAEVKAVDFKDADGCYVYKVVDGDITDVTEEEKAVMRAEKAAMEKEVALKAKLEEISNACNAAIVTGVNYNNADFSYNIEDQGNISRAVEFSKTGLDVPYHANGESCRLFSPNEIITVYIANENNLTHHTTYHNQLKLYVNTLETKEEIEAVVYGQELTGEYLDTYNEMMAQARKIISAYLNIDEAAVVGLLSE